MKRKIHFRGDSCSHALGKEGKKCAVGTDPSKQKWDWMTGKTVRGDIPVWWWHLLTRSCTSAQRGRV